MDLSAYLRILRQRWLLVLLPALAALLVAVLTLPDRQEPVGPVATTYRATATLITSPTQTATTAPVSLATVALFTTTGEIPQRAAELLDYQGEPQVLASQITVVPNAETGTLMISTTNADGREAASTVNRFAEATIDYFRTERLAQNRARLKELNLALGRTSEQLEALRVEQVAGAGGPVLEAKIAALQEQYSIQFSEMSTLNRAAGAGDLLTVLQPGVPIPQDLQTFSAPSNPLARIGIAALLGLLLGSALALVVERLDSRMRTREQVEDAFGLPVLAEVPILPRKHREEISSVIRPASAVAESFRSLRSSVLLLSPGRARISGKQGQRSNCLTILVTSALPGEGKTTTVANLAATMAEAGRRVLVLSLDLRNPRLHQIFHVSNGTGVSDLLAAGRGPHLREVVRETSISGVSIVTSGHHLDHPGALLSSAASVIDGARSLCDVMLIDAPPMLTVSDAMDIAGHADVTLLVTRLNKTTRAQAEECQRVFERLGVVALGTVLMGSRPAGARYGYPVLGEARWATTSPSVTETPTD